VRISFLGVRGSTSSPGAEYVRYGGHTSCVALTLGDDARPRLVLDAGTGLRRLPELMDGHAFDGTILLTHLHWDHTHGLPFCRATDRDDAIVRLALPDQGVEAEALLARSMGPPHFPIEPSGLRGRWRFDTLAEGVHEVEGAKVLAREVPHKGGRTFGYRIEHGGSSVAYVPDHGPGALGGGDRGLGPFHRGILELAEGVDVLIHDAQHTAEEYPRVASFGHAAADYAVELGERAGVGTVVLFHHDPWRDDAAQDALVAAVAAPASVSVVGATETLVLDLPPT
jgi:phosphoribosyl 1,2-cyclic phosphodiesterase